MTAPPSPRDVLGIPVVPPVGATRVLRWFRRALAGTHRATALPPLAIQEGLAGLYDNRVLGLLVELGIPDRLDRPRTAAELAAAVGADPEALDRVLRFASTRRFVTARRGGRYAASPVSEFLRADHPSSWALTVQSYASDWFWSAWRDLDLAVGADRERLRPAATGDPEAVGTSVQGLALSRDLSWHGVSTVCDVGGGSGAALEVLLAEHPDLAGTLLDRPEVVAEARAALRAGPLAPRCSLVGGDFLEAVPEGADRYLLMAIMTESDDERAVAVLSTVRRAMVPGSRLLVVDNVLSPRPRDEYAQRSDLLLLVLSVGRERTEAAYRTLFAAAGLRVVGAHPLLTGSTAFELASG